MNHKFNSQLLIILLSLLFKSNSLFSQIYINGNMNFSGTSSIFSNAELGPDALIYFENGAEVDFLGTTLTVNAGTEFTSPTSPTGKLIFAGSTGQQTIVGGNSSSIGGAQPSFINLEIDNPDGVSLNTSNTRITGNLLFTQGHLVLNNQNLEMSSTATTSNANGTRHVVTNGTGFMAKESFSSAFSFPVGHATSDFTPATITPTSNDDFFVQVKDYSESASHEVTTNNDGIDRTWNIYSTSGTGATIALQHNSASNQSNYASNGGDVAAFVTQYQGIQWVPNVGNQGTWQLGTNATGTNSAGSIASSVLHNRVYSSTATTSTANGAFFSKSTLSLTPLPITLIEFNAIPEKYLVSKIIWSTSTEVDNSHFIIETSINGNQWNEIGTVKGAGNSSHVIHYQLLHPNAHKGINYYRLTMVDFDGNKTLSEIKLVEFNHGVNQQVQIYPNPSHGIVNIQSNNNKFSYTLTSLDGKIIMLSDSQTSGLKTLDISHLENAMYLLNVISNDQMTTYKIVLNK